MRTCGRSIVVYAGAVTIGVSCAALGQGAASRPADAYTVACYYFPNYHADARNEARYGKGWTEWELIKQATPRFAGHHQPNVPAWGYVDEADAKVMARKIDAAADAGVDAFIYDWYYYNDGPFLQRGLEEGFMKAVNASRMKFGLMWANHNWVEIFPKKTAHPPLVYPGKVTPETWERITDHIVKTYFPHPSYWKIDGKPYFSIYEVQTFVENFGNLEDARRGLEAFRAKTRAAGFGDVHLNAVVWGNPILPGEKAPRNWPEVVAALGFDSVTSYVWIHHVALPEFPQTPYAYVMKKSMEFWRKTVGEFRVPYYPNVTMGWDSSPRTDQSKPLDNSGYPAMASMSGNTPEAFREALAEARRFLDARPAAQRILTINAWNEWTEGSYLEPDTVHGTGYLDAIRAVFGNAREAPR